MTLRQFLEQLPADPTEGNDPKLIVGEELLTPAQREEITGAAYARRPFCVLAGLPRGAPRRLHNRATRLTGGVDVHLFHPATGGILPDSEALGTLQARILDAQRLVTEISPGYSLATPLIVVTEIDPRTETFEKLDGLTAVTRFSYAVWR